MRKNYLNMKNAQTHVIIFAVLILVSVILFISADNITEADNNDTITDESLDLCADIECYNLEIVCPDGINVSCSTECNVETGECSECVPDCTGHDGISEIVQPSENTTENQNAASPDNETFEEGLNTSNETIEQQEPKVVESPSLSIDLIYHKKITRGETIEIKVIISNAGGVAKSVSGFWIVPKGFEIVSNEINECGDLIKGESCTLNLLLETSLETTQGFNKIDVEVNYE